MESQKASVEPQKDNVALMNIMCNPIGKEKKKGSEIKAWGRETHYPTQNLRISRSELYVTPYHCQSRTRIRMTQLLTHLRAVHTCTFVHICIYGANAKNTTDESHEANTTNAVDASDAIDAHQCNGWLYIDVL